MLADRGQLWKNRKMKARRRKQLADPEHLSCVYKLENNLK